MKKENQEKPSDNSTLYLGTGIGLGAYATATTILAGVTCPLCVVAAPALIATGVYQKFKKNKKQSETISKSRINE